MIYSNPIKINENYSYTHDDIGLILYESEMNSMRIFEATLQADFAQITGLREGTLLESEVEAIKESNFDDFKKKIVASIEVFWNKIKSMLNNFKNKLLETFESDEKPFITHFYKTINKNYKHKLNRIIHCTLFDWDAVDAVNWKFNYMPVLEGNKNFDDYCKAWYKAFTDHEYDDETEFISYIESTSTYVYKISPSMLEMHIDVLISKILDTKFTISRINDLVKVSNASIDNVKKYILSKYTTDSNLINKYNISVNAFQKVISIAQSTLIKNIRRCRNNCRIALKEILRDVCNGEEDDSELDLYTKGSMPKFVDVEEPFETVEAVEEE